MSGRARHTLKTIGARKRQRWWLKLGWHALAVIISLFLTNQTLVGLAAEKTEMVPLTELGTGTYLGFQGGLYPGGSNQMPEQHKSAGEEFTHQIQPLDTAGSPSSSGRIVLLSIGMSNTSREFCGKTNRDCWPGTFIHLAQENPSVEQTGLTILNGAQSGQAARAWISSSGFKLRPDQR